MEKDQFTDVEHQAWWLLELKVESALEQKRTTLGNCWEWSELLWFTERRNLEEVFQFLELNRRDLLRELDEADTPYRREQWLDNVIQAKGSPKEQAAPQKAGLAAKKVADLPAKPDVAPPTVPAKKPSPFAQKAAAAETPAAAGTPAGAQPAPPKKASPFTKKAAAPETPAAAGTPAGAQPAPPKKASLFTKKAAARETTPSPAGAGEAAQGVDQVEAVSAQIKSVMSDLSADELSSIARDLGLTADEIEAMVRDPDFASMVAEEQSQLESR